MTLDEQLDEWEASERRTRLRQRLRDLDGVDPDDVILSPEAASARGLASTMCLPVGNLAPDGAVIKSTAIDPSVVDPDGVYRFTGPAKVFVSEPAAIAAIKAGQIKSGDVLVLICRGPMGAGMEETYQLTSALKYLDFGKHVALLTDARFSGVSTGACIGHVSPEALAGGPIGKLRDGDLIRIVIDRGRLEGTVDFIGESRTSSSMPKTGARMLRRSRRRDRTLRRSRAARRHAAVGRAAGRQRRHVGRLRVRCRSHSRSVGGWAEGVGSRTVAAHDKRETSAASPPGR